MKRFLSVAAIALFLPLVSAAQGQIKAQLFGGYSLAAKDFTYLPGVPNGWNASLNVGNSHWGFLSDFGGYYNRCCQTVKSDTYTFLFGPQFTESADKYSVFVHALAGGAHNAYSDSSSVGNTSGISNPTTFAFGFGGGVDIRITHSLALRVQGDFLHTGIQTLDNQLHPTRWNGRFSTGIVIDF